MGYKEGDIVIITAPKGYYCASANRLAHLEEMDAFNGKICVIRDIDSDGDLLLKNEHGVIPWYWSTEWVAPYNLCDQDEEFADDMTNLL